MSVILKSASKIVLLIFSLAIVAGLFTGHIPADAFMDIAKLVFLYYFLKRAEKPGEADKP